MFPMNRCHHGLLIDSHYGTIDHGSCRANPKGLTCKAAFSKKIALVQNRYCGFLPGF
jgi:hypothetical protein